MCLGPGGSHRRPLPPSVWGPHASQTCACSGSSSHAPCDSLYLLSNRLSAGSLSDIQFSRGLKATTADDGHILSGVLMTLNCVHAQVVPRITARQHTLYFTFYHTFLAAPYSSSASRLVPARGLKAANQTAKATLICFREPSCLGTCPCSESRCCVHCSIADRFSSRLKVVPSRVRQGLEIWRG